MSEIVVAGAGLNGLSVGVLLARAGHHVTVVERDPAPPPSDHGEALWRDWERRGVNQFRMLHFMLPRWRALMEAHLPEVLTTLEARGGVRMNLVTALPGEFTGGWRAGDEVFEFVTARRPILEAAVAEVAEGTDGLEVRRGVAISGLATGPGRDAVPHVAGVITEGGETLRADLVVDACGRRSPLPSWLDAIGARRGIEERDDSGFVYYGRHFRSRDGERPNAMCGLLSHYASLSVLTLPADNDTWGVGFVAAANDRALRALRQVDVWERVLAHYPLVAHWMEGEPISDGVAVMAGIEDRHRSLVVDERPVATGVVTVGDSWACTNPSLGRGASIGLLHSIVLRDVIDEVGLEDAEKLVRRFHERTTTDVEPLHRMTLEFDRHRLAEIDADREGREYETDDVTWRVAKALGNAAPLDPDVLRGYLSVASLLETPEEVLARPGLFDRVMELAPGLPQYITPGPDRTELLRIIEG